MKNSGMKRNEELSEKKPTMNDDELTQRKGKGAVGWDPRQNSGTDL